MLTQVLAALLRGGVAAQLAPRLGCIPITRRWLATATATPPAAAAAATDFSDAYNRRQWANSTLSAEDKDTLRQFHSTITLATLPTHTFDVRHSRSSGRGGQNVNKVNTKVDLRFNLKAAESWLPPVVQQRLRQQEARRINRDNEFIVTSERTRYQHTNYEDCISKLLTILKDVSDVGADPSVEKVQRVERLASKANQQRIQEKKRASSKKQNRNEKNW